MKTGNQVQAVILSVVAVGAIGFLVMRLIPAKVPTVQEREAEARSANGKLSTLAGLPTDVYRDAFSHPALALRVAATKQTEAVTEKVTKKSGPDPSTFLNNGALPVAFQQGRFSVESAGKDDEAVKPSGITEKSQQEEKKPQLRIGLKAIMRATKPVALISLDGQPELLVSPGDQLTRELKVGRFTQNAVQLTSASGSFWIYVGSEVKK